MISQNILLLIALAPLFGAIVAGLFGRQIGRAGAHTVTILGVAVSCAASIYVLWQLVQGGAPTYNANVYTWFEVGGYSAHVGFLVDRPLPVPGRPGAYAVRVADSTSWGHQDDTRPQDGIGGFGIGTLVFLTDGHGHGTAYGWFGTQSDGYVVTPIVFGRVTR